MASQPRFRSVNKCAICVLVEQGVMNAEDKILQQYVQLDPSKPPMPLGAEGEDAAWNLFPEEEDKKLINLPTAGIWGTVKSVYRAIGFVPKTEREQKQEAPESKKVATRRRKGSLYSD